MNKISTLFCCLLLVCTSPHLYSQSLSKKPPMVDTNVIEQELLAFSHEPITYLEQELTHATSPEMHIIIRTLLYAEQKDFNSIKKLFNSSQAVALSNLSDHILRSMFYKSIFTRFVEIQLTKYGKPFECIEKECYNYFTTPLTEYPVLDTIEECISIIKHGPKILTKKELSASQAMDQLGTALEHDETNLEKTTAARYALAEIVLMRVLVNMKDAHKANQ